MSENQANQGRLPVLVNLTTGDNYQIVGPSTKLGRAPENEVKAKAILAMLKLGQFDRDENNYELAKTELEQANKDAQNAINKSKYLQFQCLNSYADYLKQVGKKAEAEALLKQADSIGPTDEMVK